MYIYFQNEEEMIYNLENYTVFKAILLADGSCAIVVKYDDNRDSETILREELNVKNNDIDAYVIICTNKGILFDIESLNKSRKQKREILPVIKDFMSRTLNMMIKKPLKDGDKVRAEVIRQYWKIFDLGNKIKKLCDDDSAVQKELNKVENASNHKIPQYETAIYDLVIKYAMQLILYEKKCGKQALINLMKSNLSKHQKTNNDDFKWCNELWYSKKVQRNFDRFNNAYIIPYSGALFDETKIMHANIYAKMKYGKPLCESQNFFYNDTVCPGKGPMDERKKNYVTIVSLMELYTYLLLEANQAQAKEFLFINQFSQSPVFDTDVSWYIINQLVASAEIILCSVTEINRQLLPKGIDLHPIYSVIDRLQIEIFPMMYYVRAEAYNNTLTDKEKAKRIPFEKKKEEIAHKLNDIDGYSLFGKEIFLDDDPKHPENRDDPDKIKKSKDKARDYWNKRIEHLKKVDINRTIDDLVQQTTRQCSTMIMNKFDNYLTIQNDELNRIPQKSRVKNNLNELEKMDIKFE